MPAICKRREAESRALHWVIIGSMAGDEIALSGVLLRKRNLHILGSGQGATTAAEMFGIAPQIVEAFANGTLSVEMREVPLAEVGEWWTRPSKERIVFVP
jgi:NADPH2:quinone reductase